MATRVAIIGAGLAGLSAANTLVDEGADVTLFERAAHPGGRAATTDHGPYRFNQGPHALYVDGVARRELTRLGITLRAHPPVTKRAKALYRGELHAFPDGPLRLARARFLGLRAKRDLAVLLARADRIPTSAQIGRSAADWIDSVSDQQSVTAMLEALVRLTTYTNAPDLIDAGAVVNQLQLGVKGGVLYLDGGWGQIINALADRAKAKGATLEQQSISKVDEVLANHDGVVVACGAPATVAAMIDTDQVDGADLVNAAGPPVETAVLELGVTAVPKIRFVLGVDEPLYASVHAPPADLAPPGHSVVYLARYLAPGEQHEPAEVRRQFGELARSMGIADDSVAEERYLHRMTVVNGIPLASRGGFAGRPASDLAGDPRVVVAGDWVGGADGTVAGDGGLLADASVASATDAVRKLLAGRPQQRGATTRVQAPPASLGERT